MTAGTSQLLSKVVAVVAKLDPGARVESVIPVRETRKLVCRVSTSSKRIWYAKAFADHATYRREAQATIALGPTIAPTVVAAVERAGVMVTDAVSGELAADCGPVMSGKALRRCLPAFTKILKTNVHAPRSPLPIPEALTESASVRLLAALAAVPEGQVQHWLSVPQPLCPCHGDLTPNNVVVTSHGVRLLDFEYFGTGPALYDAATLCLSPSLHVSAMRRARALTGYARAVEVVSGAAVSADVLAGAATLWAVRFSECLRVEPASVDTHLHWTSPLRVAAAVLRSLRCAP